MMIKIRLIVLFVLMAVVASCSRQNRILIEGKLEKPEKGYMYINKIDIDMPVRIDSVKIRKNGTFRLKIKAIIPEFYQLGITSRGFITLLAEPGEKISVIFRTELLSEEYSVTGSPGTARLMLLDSALSVTQTMIDSLRKVYNGVYGKPGFEDKEQELNQAYTRILKDQRMFNINFILNNLRSFASIKAIYQKLDDQTYVLYDPRDIQFMKIVSDTLNFYYPSSKQARALKSNFEQEKSRFYVNQLQQIAQNAPVRVLDPNLADLEGKRIALSSLKGKYVLLAFWSAASKDCVAENLELKKLYSKYKNRGFEIYQINLDLDENTWRRAVKFDELQWINVREDDPSDPKIAILYNVKILPANYLYDKNGEIIASNLHGRELQVKLTQIFGF